MRKSCDSLVCRRCPHRFWLDYTHQLTSSEYQWKLGQFHGGKGHPSHGHGSMLRGSWCSCVEITQKYDIASRWIHRDLRTKIEKGITIKMQGQSSKCQCICSWEGMCNTTKPHQSGMYVRGQQWHIGPNTITLEANNTPHIYKCSMISCNISQWPLWNLTCLGEENEILHGKHIQKGT